MSSMCCINQLLLPHQSQPVEVVHHLLACNFKQTRKNLSDVEVRGHLAGTFMACFIGCVSALSP